LLKVAHPSGLKPVFKSNIINSRFQIQLPAIFQTIKAGESYENYTNDTVRVIFERARVIIPVLH